MSLESLKKSRSIHLGIVTREKNKYSAMESQDPSTFNLRKLKEAIKKVEGKHEELKQTQSHIMEYDKDINEEDEKRATAHFEENVESTIDIIQNLIELNRIHIAVHHLHEDLDSLAKLQEKQPEREHSAAANRHSDSYEKLRTMLDESSLERDHQYFSELKRLQDHLSFLTSTKKEVRHSPIVSDDDHHHPSRRPSAMKRPNIELPKFYGNIMDWNSFWTSFVGAIDSDPDLSQINKLAYLRGCIKDPNINPIIFNGVNNEHHYDEVVQQLREHYDQPKVVHAAYCNKMIETSPIKHTQADLNSYANDINHVILGLKTLKQYDIESCFTSLAVQRLPKHLKELWQLECKATREVAPIDKLVLFIKERAAAVGAGMAVPSLTTTVEPQILVKHEKKQDRNPQERNPRHKAAVHVSSPSPAFKFECVLCKPEKHPLYHCTKFRAMDVKARREHVRNYKLCFNCLIPGHRNTECRNSGTCRLCSGKHNTLVHQADQAQEVRASTNSATSSNPPDILMMTSKVLLKGPGGRTFTARALLDSGSTLTLVSSKAVQALQLPTTSKRITFSGVQDTPVQSSSHVVTLSLSPMQASSQDLQISAAVVDKVTCNLPLQGASAVKRLPHLRDLPLADPTFDMPGKIDLLLGGDILPQVMMPDIKTGAGSTPIAWRTVFGWAIFGPFQSSNNNHSITNSSMNHYVHVESSSDQLLKQFWEVEELSPNSKAFTPEEEAVQTHYNETHSYIPSLSRYQVTLPKKTGAPELGESKTQALQRFRSNEASTIRKGTWTEFQRIVQEYLDLNHAQPVTPTELANLNSLPYYLPMHAVQKESSTSTKTRVVFDASARTSTGHSLNDTLMVGPTLHPTLETILIRFRSYSIALTGDIAKMYRGVEISPSDRHLHRFLWRKNPTDPIQEYEMTRVTFGVAASPYLAVRTLQQTAKDHSQDPVASYHISNSFYVDDLLGGANSVEEAKALRVSLCEILSKGGFKLCKFRSSNPIVTNSINPDLREKLPIKGLTDVHASPHPKALGLEWNSESDCMSTSLNLSSEVTPTKRGIISDIARTFDVLGWIAPSVILMKILYQNLWVEKLDWDEVVPMSFQSEHAQWKKQLHLLNSKQLPRCYYRIDSILTSVQLHGFSDASEKAYSAVVYARSTYDTHQPLVTLVSAKTKVAPLKSLSIPRLELCGADLLAKLIDNIRQALGLPVECMNAWCDSTIVLSWLDGSPKRYRTFVGNRIAAILKLVPPQCWAHVPTDLNPADCASRGLMPADLAKFNLWWEGPSYLATEPLNKPDQPMLNPEAAPELRPVVACHLITQKPPEFMEGRFSNYHYTLKITAWCMRFINNLKATSNHSALVNTPHLNSTELRRAEYFLFRQSQARTFEHEVKQLQSHQPISNKSKIMSLTPFLCQDGLLRVGGRLSQANLSHSQKHPVILYHQCSLVNSLFKYNHVVMGHCGPTLLLSAVGSRLHVVGARQLARAVCRSCTICRRISAKSEHQMMGQLPSQRIEPHFPFQITGIDYAGPLTIKKGHTRKPILIKAYLAIFVCFSTKAVHLEVIEDLSTEDFLAGLKRFISRRGLPSEIHSDNGKNFVGAKNDLCQLYKLLQTDQVNSSISSYLLSQRIDWICIPERSPHFGGLWEAAVKSTKFHLKRITGALRFTISELHTITCQIEACLNSRPLSPINSHSMDGIQVLTPGHFLVGRPLTCYPETIIDTQPSLLKRWTMCQSIVHHFWLRWSKEYLQQMQVLAKWRSPTPNLQIGDVVIIREDTPFTCRWPVAIVEQTFPGRDGLVRVVLLKTTSTSPKAQSKGDLTHSKPAFTWLKRPVTKVALLYREASSTSSPPSSGTIVPAAGSMFEPKT